MLENQASRVNLSGSGFGNYIVLKYMDVQESLGLNSPQNILLLAP